MVGPLVQVTNADQCCSHPRKNGNPSDRSLDRPNWVPNTFGVREDRNGLRHDNRPRFAGQRLGHRPALIIVSRAWRGNWCGLLGWRGFTVGERPAKSTGRELSKTERAGECQLPGPSLKDSRPEQCLLSRTPFGPRGRAGPTRPRG